MGFFRNFLERFISSDGNNNVEKKEICITSNEEYRKAYADVYINYLAFYSCVNRIANAFCKCKFETFSKYNQIEKDEWYLWNIQPNKNQSAYAFKNQLINMLYKNNEALVIETNNGDLYVADSYNHDEYTLYEDIFKNVMVRNMNMGTYKQSQVLFFKLNDTNVKRLINGMMELYNNLIKTSVKAYSASKGGKIFLNVDEIAMGNEDFEETYQRLLEEDFKNFFDNNNAVIPLFAGYSINDNSKMPDASSTPKDFIDLVTKVTENTAIALNVPITLAKGDVQDTSKVIDEFLTFCIDPLVEMIEQEIMRKRYGLSEYKKGNFMKINSKTIKHIDIFDIATAVEKLISSACFTVNDIRKALGMPLIDEDWANQFFMTKNFSTVEDLMNALKGGGING